MSIHDYVLANDTGANFRADLNSALAAIVSHNSNATEPSTMYAYQLWADTTTGLLKIRNAANNGWITVGTLASTNLGLASLAGATFTGQLVSAVGAIGAPGIAFAGDLNTGMYWISADKFAIVLGGVAVATFDAATTSYLTLNGTGAVKLPVGTTGQRPTDAAGLIRYNSTLSQFEGNKGSGFVPLGGGGGGAGFTWKALASNAPIEAEENSEQVYLFAQTLAQELYASVKVPNSYVAGAQIFIYVSGYSPSSSNTVHMKAQSTLIRKDTDAFTSTTNQRTTTNAALTNNLANELQEWILDVTDSSGQINSVAVAAGDVIKVKLYRDSADTDTADLRLLPNATDVKFS